MNYRKHYGAKTQKNPFGTLIPSPPKPNKQAGHDERGWQVGKSLVDRQSHAFDQQVNCDVTFTFPKCDSIGAHSFVLKTGSPVFEAMLSGNFSETSKVDIVDIQRNVFTEMLRYLYTDGANVTADNAIPLLYAAKKYIITGLSEVCTSFLTDQVNNQNVCTILNGSLQYEEESLVKTCLDYIRTNISAIAAQEADFNELSENALLSIVKDDMIQIQESALWDACVNWAKARLKQSGKATTIRSKLGDILFQIRFHQMQPQDFAAKIGSDNSILTDKEKNHILCYSLTKSDEEKTKLERLGFNVIPRNCHVMCHGYGYEPFGYDNKRLPGYGGYEQQWNDFRDNY